jgi:ATP-dependent Clp protease ATP-binding subunit ClpX
MFILWKKSQKLKLLIAGIDAHICDKCIEQAHGIVLEELKSGKFKIS